jgi:hypothetical protein
MDCEFHPHKSQWIPLSEFRILSTNWIPDATVWIVDSVRWIPESEAQIWITDSLHGLE